MNLSADIRRSTTHYDSHKYPFTFLTVDYAEAKSRRASLQNDSPYVTVNTGQLLSCLKPTFQPTVSIDDSVTVLYAAAVVVVCLVLFSEFTFAICRRPSVCLSVTLVHPTQAIEIFRNVSTPLGTLDIY